jgi:phosphoenolpyruvate carboxykinase (ATP)
MLLKSISRIARTFASYDARLYKHPSLSNLGITNPRIYRNMSAAELYEHAIDASTNWTNDPKGQPALIAENGALVAYSSDRTGRSPKERRIVMDNFTKDEVYWSDVNIPMEPKSFDINRSRAIDYLNNAKRLYVVDGFAGWDPKWRLKCRVICELPYHALFMRNMMVVPKKNELHEFENGGDFTILNAGMFRADLNTQGVKNKTSVVMNFTKKELVVLGTLYAGEMKKGLFGVMNTLMPLKGQLSMHASANEGVDKDVSLFFGLSGTGKTTLSADPKRALIGDDEHVWTDNGVFNIEGGCYAKCCFLSKEKEPDIYNALRFGTVLENVKFTKPECDRIINYDDISITENTRASYPLEFIPNAKFPAVGGHPKNIIFLTCDAYGVLPPVAKLTPEQAMYQFISGYTAKVAGTEVGIKEPVSTFSACFGEAFIPLHPYKYAALLADKMKKHNTNVWLVNSGWSAGAYPNGARMSLKLTRAILDAIHSGELEKIETQKMDLFGLQIPIRCPKVDPKVLVPINTWADKDLYQTFAKKLAQKFIDNFKRYEANCGPEVKELGGPKL